MVRWMIPVVFLSITVAASADVYSVGETFDLQGHIDNALRSGRKHIVIKSGRYRVTPRDRQHLLLHGLSDVEIVARGVELICTETTRALTISSCRNVTIRGLAIDYDPLPFTQGRIVAISQNNTVHDIELFDGYPGADEVEEFKYEIFRPDVRTLRFGSYHEFSVERIGVRRIRVTRTGRYQGEEVGDIIVIGTKNAPGGSIPHAVYTTESENVAFEDVTLYASNCFGFFESECVRTVYRRCVVDRRAAAEDLRQREDARIRSLDADAFHSKHAGVGPQLIECTARFQGDDCINICGDYHMVMASQASRLRVLAKHRMNIRIGDPLEVVTYQGLRLPDARAVSVRRIGDIRDDELAFLAKQRMHQPFREGSLRTIYEVVIDRAVELPRGSIIAAANRIGNGFAVIGCDFGFNRSRGILIKASNGRVADNRLRGCWGEAIKVAPEFWWLEAGSSNGVRIVGNRIDDCLGDGIAVYAEAGAGGFAPAGAHNEIVIEGNTISNTLGKDIRVTSTRRLVLRNNLCEATDIHLANCLHVQSDVPELLSDISPEVPTRPPSAVPQQ